MSLMSFNITDSNRAILQGIGEKGLIPGASHKGGPLSADQTPYPLVAINVVYSIKPDCPPPLCSTAESINSLLWNGAKGLFPIVAERPPKIRCSPQWVFYSDPSDFDKRISEVYRSSIYLQIDAEKLPPGSFPPSQLFAPTFDCGGVFERAYPPIPRPAIIRAFVPQHLKTLAQECLPGLELIPVGDTECIADTPVPSKLQGKRIGGCRLSSRIASPVRIPDYRSAITPIIEEAFVTAAFTSSQTALAFHAVRLFCAEDAKFREEKSPHREGETIHK